MKIDAVVIRHPSPGAPYHLKEFIDAKAEFSKVIELKFNGDNLSKYYINNCDNIINSNLPKNWQPIIETRK